MGNPWGLKFRKTSFAALSFISFILSREAVAREQFGHRSMFCD